MTKRGPKPGAAVSGGAEVGKLGGRPPAQATIRPQNWAHITQVLPDGGVVHHGRGEVVEVKKSGVDRVVVIRLTDGSTINILVLK